MTHLPFCSVVVPTYQREKVLCDTIAYLLDLSYPHYELLVVDQTPLHEPETEQFLQQVAQRIRYIHIDQVGMCHARNVGIEAAKGDIILFCDDDIIPTPDLLTNHVRHYRDPAVGGVTGPCGYQPLDGPVYLVREFYRVRGRGGDIPRHPLPTTVVETEGAQGCNMSFRKQILVRIGGFDEGFIIYARREETDASLRVRALGYRILFDPQASIEHLAFPSGGGRAFINQEKLFVFGELHNHAYYFAKHIPLWHLPFFLYYQLGRLLYRQIWQRRRVDFLYPGLTGLADGLWRGHKARRQMRAQLEQAKRQE